MTKFDRIIVITLLFGFIFVFISLMIILKNIHVMQESINQIITTLQKPPLNPDMFRLK